MNKEMFMNKLKDRIRRLPQEEYNDAIAYYEEFFDECDNEAEVIGKLGTPEQVAAQILADFGERELKDNSSAGRKTWIMILAIFSFPVLVPVAIALIVVAFSMFVTIFSLIISGGVVMIAGVAAMALSFLFIFQDISAWLLFFGSGLMCVGIGGVMISGCMWLAKISSVALAKFGSMVLRRSSI